MTPTEYERAVLQRFRTLCPPPQFVVKHNIGLIGYKTQARRQIDVSVFERGKSKPILIGEAKRYKRPIHAGIAGSTIALVQDVGGIPAIMVSTSSFSRAAINHLGTEGIAHLTITLTEARGLRWVPYVERAFAVDNEFREISGHLVESLRVGEPTPFLGETGLPYEEWLAVMRTALGRFPAPTARVLFALARDHYDDAVRFNAVQLLDDADQLTASDISALLAAEQDPENIDLLWELAES
jgi:hypothetical protein